MDTNVFISELKQDALYHAEASAIIRKITDGDLVAETSVLTLLETASVASRLYNARMAGEEGMSESERKIFIIKAIGKLASLKPRFVHLAGDSPPFLRSVRTDLPQIFSEAILMSLLIPLRTFDLIHLAAARYAKQTNQELGAFVTGDNGLLSKKEELTRIIGMPILSPKEYVQALGFD